MEVARVATRELPAVTEAATMLMIPRPAPWWRQSTVWTTAAAAFTLVAAFLVLKPGSNSNANPVASAPAQVDSASAPPPAPAATPEPPAPPAPPPGSLRLLANPANAEILVDGRVVKHEHELVGIDLPAVRRQVEATVEHLQSTLGEEAWNAGMNPDVPETKILDNPYQYTDYRSAATHSSSAPA